MLEEDKGRGGWAGMGKSPISFSFPIQFPDSSPRGASKSRWESLRLETPVFDFMFMSGTDRSTGPWKHN